MDWVNLMLALKPESAHTYETAMPNLHYNHCEPIVYLAHRH